MICDGIPCGMSIMIALLQRSCVLWMHPALAGAAVPIEELREPFGFCKHL